MFMEEGFTDFIAKPIELSVLERVLRRYIPVQKQINVEEDTIEEQTDHDNSHMSRETSTPKAEGSAAKKAESEKEALDALRAAGINVEQGIAYCGDEEGLREVIMIYHAEGDRRNKQLEQFMKDQDWKNYVITVHALKSNSKGIGAKELTELALNLEMAGKENRIDYILEHHEELLEKHKALLHAFAQNTFLYPEGYHDGKAEKNEAKDDEKSVKGAENIEHAESPEDNVNGEEIGGASLGEQIALLRAKLDSFESDGLDVLLEQIKMYRHRDINLKEMTNEIKSRVDDFDFLGAAEVLDSWEEKIAVGTM